MSAAELLAVVEVAYAARIVCQAPGCGHSVYKRIHVVSQGGALQVLGSDCFSRLFGGGVRQRPQFGGSAGRVLTPEERNLLLNNTAQLIEQFKAEHEVELEAQRLAQQQRAVPAPSRLPVARALKPGLVASRNGPWPWMKPLASMGYFRLKDGTGWVRVLRTDEQHMLVPWPPFEGWDEAFPAHIGQVDLDCGGYVLHDVVEAVKYLRARGTWGKVCGSRRELDAEAAKNASLPDGR